MKKLYKVTMPPQERNQLEEMVSKGKNNAPKIKHAHILLAVDETVHGKIADVEIAKRFHCHANTVDNIRQRFVEQGLAAALERKKRATPPMSPIFDGRAEARLIALACSTPPEGRSAWTTQLLADKCVELRIVEKTSGETVRNGTVANFMFFEPLGNRRRVSVRERNGTSRRKSLTCWTSIIRTRKSWYW